MHTAQISSPAALHTAPHTMQGAAFAMRQAISAKGPRPVEPDEDAPFNGWLASSLELKLGLLVQTLRIDPLDAEWRALFAA